MNLGFIGLGIMGEPMACNLIKKSGLSVYVYDIDKDKVKQLEKHGAVATSNSQEVVQHADIIFTSVPKAEHVKVIHESIYEHISKGQIFVDMSTIAPKDSIMLADKLKEYGAEFLDAPVVKSKQAAIDGTLGIYVGGDKQTYQKVKPYLEMIGSSLVYMGTNGKGLIMKICHNMLVGEIQNGVNEMMLLAQKNGIDWRLFKEAISIGGGKNFYLETKAQAIGTQDYTTAFSVENMCKDVKIAKELIAQHDLELPGAALVQNIYQEAIAENLGSKDFAATYEVVAKKQVNKT